MYKIGEDLYVSDILEEMLNASSVRNITREVTFKIIGRLHPKLDVITEYIGGKCMGYPSIWFVQKALQLNDADLDRLLMNNHSALFISLSTSIGDDLVDKDENTNIGHLALLYLLLFKGLANQNAGKVNEIIYQSGLKVMMGMLDSNLEHDFSHDEMEGIGNKIGLFHKTICFEMLANLGELDIDKEALLSLSGKFGCWCSELDDFIDIERDIESGQYFTRPVLTLLSSGTEVKRAVLEKNYQLTNDIIKSEAFLNRNINTLVYRLQVIAQDAYKHGFNELGLTLDSILSTLPGKLYEIRNAARVIYIAKSKTYATNNKSKVTT